MKYQIVSERTSKESYQIKSPNDAFAALEKFKSKRKEHFLILTLDGAHQVIRMVIVTIGLANRTMVHPREVFQPAIKDGACAIIIAHNHPSGSLDPSPEDKSITESLVKAGKILGIPVLDHVIISKRGYYSFQETGEMPSGGRE